MARLDFVTGNAQRYLPEVEALATVPERIEAALAGYASDEFLRAPAEGEWSPARVVQHITFYVRENHHNLYRMAWQDAPLMTMWDEQAYVGDEGWASLDAPSLLAVLTDSLAQMVELLKDLPDASWGRAGDHPRAGRRSIRQQVRRCVEHYDEHIAQLEEMLSGA